MKTQILITILFLLTINLVFGQKPNNKVDVGHLGFTYDINFIEVESNGSQTTWIEKSSIPKFIEHLKMCNDLLNKIKNDDLLNTTDVNVFVGQFSGYRFYVVRKYIKESYMGGTYIGSGIVVGGGKTKAFWHEEIKIVDTTFRNKETSILNVNGFINAITSGWDNYLQQVKNYEEKQIKVDDRLKELMSEI